MFHPPLTVTRDNALTVTGMSWREVLRYARTHGVPVFKISRNRSAVDGVRLISAMNRDVVARNPTRPPVPKAADDVDRLLIELGILR